MSSTKERFSKPLSGNPKAWLGVQPAPPLSWAFPDRHFLAAQRGLSVLRLGVGLYKAQRLSQTGSFGWRPSAGEILWSEETFRIFQYDGTKKPTVELVLQRVHPERHNIGWAMRDYSGSCGVVTNRETKAKLDEVTVRTLGLKMPAGQ